MRVTPPIQREFKLDSGIMTNEILDSVANLI